MMVNRNSQTSAEKQKQEILQRLVGMMISPDTPVDARQDAKRSLRRIGNDTIVETLGDVIEDSDDIAAVTDATDILGFLPVTPTVSSSLLRLLWHESHEVRRSAMEALSRIGDPATASVLSILVTDSRNPASIFDMSDEDMAQRALAAILRRSPQN